MFQETVLLIVGIAFAPAFVSVLCDQSVLIARRNYRGVAALNAAQPILNVMCILTGWISGHLTVSWVLASSIMSTALSCGYGRFLVRVPRGDEFASYLGLARESVTYAGSEIAESASNRLDQILMVSIIGAHSAGYYSVAVSLAALPIIIGHAVGASVFRDAAHDADRSRYSVASRAVRSALMFGCVSSALLAALSPWLVPWVFGSGFEGALTPVLILQLGAPAAVSGYVATVLLGAQNRGGQMTVAQISGLLVGIGALYVLGPPLGAIGASIASVVGYWLVFIAALAMLRLSPRELLIRPGDVRDAFSMVFGAR
jgi:O-antigen/teichoic acid export membrane protein